MRVSIVLITQLDRDVQKKKTRVQDVCYYVLLNHPLVRHVLLSLQLCTFYYSLYPILYFHLVSYLFPFTSALHDATRHPIRAENPQTTKL